MLRKTVGYCLQTLIIKCIKLKQKKCVNTFIRMKLYLILVNNQIIQSFTMQEMSMRLIKFNMKQKVLLLLDFVD